jgi:RNA polymerase sigma-70 factor (ECF subfamily)
VIESSSRSIEAFEALLREHDRAVRSVAYRMVGGDVDDVLQQAYLKAFGQWSGFRGESTFRTWLHRIVYTTALDHLRSTKRREQLHLRVATDERTTDAAQSVVDHLELERALAALPVDQRVALLLVDGQGLGYDEAAAVLDVPAGTIASRLNRARAAMRAELSKGDLR